MGIDCCIVNNFLRGNIRLSDLSESDIKKLKYIIKYLNSAILKSRLEKDVDVIKGLSDSRWIEKYTVGERFTDDAFGSFSPSQDIADSYATNEKIGKKVFISQTLKKGTHALYIDAGGEAEYTLPTGMNYRIVRISHFQHTSIYYVERT